MRETVLFLSVYGRDLFGVLSTTKGEWKTYKEWWRGWNPTVVVRLAEPADKEMIQKFLGEVCSQDTGMVH